MTPQCKKIFEQKTKKQFDENQSKYLYCKGLYSLDKLILLPFNNQLSEYFIKEIDNKDKVEKK